MIFKFEDKPSTARGFEDQVCEIPYIRSGREYYHCYLGSCQSKNNSAITMTCQKGRFLASRPNSVGNAFEAEWKSNEIPLFRNLNYELSFYVLLYCQSNSSVACINAGDYLRVTLKSKDDNSEIFSEEYNYNNIGLYRIWVKKLFVFESKNDNFEVISFLYCLS